MWALCAVNGDVLCVRLSAMLHAFEMKRCRLSDPIQILFELEKIQYTGHEGSFESLLARASGPSF